MRLRPIQLALLVVTLIGAAMLVLSLQNGLLRSEPASAAGAGPEMALTITEGGFCEEDACYAEIGEDFKLGVVIVRAPAAGYVLMETYIDFGQYEPTASEDGAGPGTCSDGIDNGSDRADRLDADCVTLPFTHTPAPDVGDEIVWPDSAVEVRAQGGPGLVNHGGITAFIPPLPVSHYEGIAVEVLMTCGQSPSQGTVNILLDGDPIGGTVGAKFVEPDVQVRWLPKVNPVTFYCTGDTDGDGCSDVAEHGTDPALGGDRDWLNPWDFYDVAGPGGGPPDGIVDLPNDILGVIQHQSSVSGPRYDVQYDRGPSAGLSWNGTQPPDGVVDLPNDILGVIGQFNHSCQ